MTKSNDTLPSGDDVYEKQLSSDVSNTGSIERPLRVKSDTKLQVPGFENIESSDQVDRLLGKIRTRVYILLAKVDNKEINERVIAQVVAEILTHPIIRDYRDKVRTRLFETTHDEELFIDRIFSLVSREIGGSGTEMIQDGIKYINAARLLDPSSMHSVVIDIGTDK